MNLTRQEITIICLLLAAVITGGIVRLCRKGWTAPWSAPSITQPESSFQPPGSPPRP